MWCWLFCLFSLLFVSCLLFPTFVWVRWTFLELHFIYIIFEFCFCKDSHDGFRMHPNPVLPHLDYTAKTLFPNKVKFTGSRWTWILGGGHYLTQYSLDSISPFTLFFFNVVLAVLGLLLFYIPYRVTLSSLVKNYWNFDWNGIWFIINLEGITVFIMLSLLINECDMS